MKQILDLKYCPADTNKDGFINEKNNIKYAGYFYDAETGLYYLNARFYDPETARFIQQDSYSGNILDPLSLNLYTYAQSNPISYYDPTGHSIKSLLKKAKYTVNKAKETVKSAFNNTAKAAKQTVQKAQQTVTKAAAATKNAVVNAANEYKDNWNSGISQLKSSGTAGKLFASYSEGVVGNISNAASASVQFEKDPLGTVSESVDYFLQDPLRNNPVAAVGRYYNDIAQASYVGDWETVANRVGSGTATIAEIGAVCYTVKGISAVGEKLSSTPLRNVKPSFKSASTGIKTQNKYALTGEEHYENLKSVFGADNVKWEKTSGLLTRNGIGSTSVVSEELGIVKSRINIANGQTRFTPLRPRSNKPVSAGFSHVIDGHFDRPLANTRSIFSISKEELKEILQSKEVVKSPVKSIEGGQYLRTVDTGKIIGNTALKFGGNETTYIDIFTDKAGNLITTYPVPGK